MASKSTLARGASWVRYNPGKTIIAVLLVIAFAGVFGRAF